MRGLRGGEPRNEAPSRIVIAAHQWYGDTIGGAFRLASEFAGYLAQQGHAVSYICCAAPTAAGFAPRERLDGVEVLRYAPPPKRLHAAGRLRHHIAEAARLARAVRGEQGVTALSGHGPLQFRGALRALRGDAVFSNYTVHSPFDEEILSNSVSLHPGLGARLAARVARWIDRGNCRAADRVQTVSAYTLRMLTAKYGRVLMKKGVVSPGWADTGRIVPAGDRRALRRQLSSDWHTDDPLFFSLRRIEARMGLETLVQAAALLRDAGERFRIVLAGGGSHRETLAALVGSLELTEHVRLPGRLAEEDLPRCYAAADCFVLPTRALECFGLIVIESFAAGTPVIATRVAAIPEIAARQGEAWMFEPGDDRALAERMRGVLRGTLRPAVDLRSIAVEFDRCRVLPEWERLLLGGTRSNLVRTEAVAR